MPNRELRVHYHETGRFTIQDTLVSGVIWCGPLIEGSVNQGLVAMVGSKGQVYEGIQRHLNSRAHKGSYQVRFSPEAKSKLGTAINAISYYVKHHNPTGQLQRTYLKPKPLGVL